jgi:lipopolysaccharide transport system ATP-binding protein
MYHVQTLCAQALWIHHGRVQMRGGSFEVTQEYLAHHEKKNTRPAVSPEQADHPHPRILRAWAEDGAGNPATVFRQSDALVLQGVAYDPDDRPPVALWGVVRVDGTPIYGAHSNETGYQLERLEPKTFGFAVHMDPLLLLPGKYWLRLHTLDPEGLRLFDTVEVEIVVRGETRDYGVVALPHRWSAGRGAPREAKESSP